MQRKITKPPFWNRFLEAPDPEPIQINLMPAHHRYLVAHTAELGPEQLVAYFEAVRAPEKGKRYSRYEPLNRPQYASELATAWLSKPQTPEALQQVVGLLVVCLEDAGLSAEAEKFQHLTKPTEDVPAIQVDGDFAARWETLQGKSHLALLISEPADLLVLGACLTTTPSESLRDLHIAEADFDFVTRIEEFQGTANLDPLRLKQFFDGLQYVESLSLSGFGWLDYLRLPNLRELHLLGQPALGFIGHPKTALGSLERLSWEHPPDAHEISVQSDVLEELFTLGRMPSLRHLDLRKFSLDDELKARAFVKKSALNQQLDVFLT